MNEKKSELIELFDKLIPKEGVVNTSVDGINLFRIENSFSRVPYSYNSEIIILAQGEKKIYLGDNVITYDSSQYLVLPVPLPAECEGKVEEGKPILGLNIPINPIEMGKIVIDLEEEKKSDMSLPKGIYSDKINKSMLDASIRLLKSFLNSNDKRVLSPMIKKEIIYRVLQGEKGNVLKTLLNKNKRFFQISKVLNKIHQSYKEIFDIERLAKELGLSNSTFYNSFKAVTNTSPLQYIKKVRLHKARSFMIQDGLNANLAALKVGYESPSQFSREYKRMFGISPSKDALNYR